MESFSTGPGCGRRFWQSFFLLTGFIPIQKPGLIKYTPYGKRYGKETRDLYPDFRLPINAHKQLASVILDAKYKHGDGRIDMYAEANYSEGTTANLWITNKIKDLADDIRYAEKAKFASVSSAPKHLV